MKHKIAEKSALPLLASLAVLLLALGIVNMIQGVYWGLPSFLIGLFCLILIVYRWFADAVMDAYTDSLDQTRLSDQVYRWSMGWFIFTEFSLFATFFAVLFYVRLVVVPWLSGGYEASASLSTHDLLWPDFSSVWPLLVLPDPKQFTGPELAMVAWGIPAINTLILLLSGVTITIAHVFLVKKNKFSALTFLWMTIVLGFLFLALQAWEYIEAYQHLGLKFNSGIYGNIFYMLTGFHGVHVLLGSIILVVVALRLHRGHFLGHDHFAFEAASWYWHFVDVVWLFLFVFVYWL